MLKEDYDICSHYNYSSMKGIQQYDLALNLSVNIQSQGNSASECRDTGDLGKISMLLRSYKSMVLNFGIFRDYLCHNLEI
jgi:hypothetical protein